MNVIKYGLLISGVSSVWIIVMHFLGAYTSEKKGLGLIDHLYIPLIAVVIFLAVREFTKKGSKAPKYYTSMLEAIYIAGFNSLWVPIFTFLYYKFINPKGFEYIRRQYQIYDVGFEQTMLVEMSSLLAYLFVVGFILSGACAYIALKTTKYIPPKS